MKTSEFRGMALDGDPFFRMYYAQFLFAYCHTEISSGELPMMQVCPARLPWPPHGSFPLVINFH
jgi:hypothetical protein